MPPPEFGADARPVFPGQRNAGFFLAAVIGAIGYGFGRGLRQGARKQKSICIAARGSCAAAKRGGGCKDNKKRLQSAINHIFRPGIMNQNIFCLLLIFTGGPVRICKRNKIRVNFQLTIIQPPNKAPGLWGAVRALMFSGRGKPEGGICSRPDWRERGEFQPGRGISQAQCLKKTFFFSSSSAGRYFPSSGLLSVEPAHCPFWHSSGYNAGRCGYSRNSRSRQPQA